MRSPLGFGKRYFTFSSMLAHSVLPTLQSCASSSKKYLKNKISSQEDKEQEDPPPENTLKILCELNAKPCHCYCYHKIKTKIILLINLFIPRCPFYTVCFAFRRTGVHPPL